MDVVTRVPRKPSLDRQRFVGCIVIHHHVDGDALFLGNRLVDGFQKLQEPLVAVAAQALPDHFTGRDTQGAE